jgi:hypothetical protein
MNRATAAELFLASFQAWQAKTLPAIVEIGKHNEKFVKPLEQQTAPASLSFEAAHACGLG